MATYYVDSTKTGGADTGGSGADAFLTLVQGTNAATAAGDVIYVSEDHNEALGADAVYTINSNHTHLNPLLIIAVTSASFGSSNTPLSGGYGASGKAQVSGETGGWAIDWLQGSFYVYGMRFILGDEDNFIRVDTKDIALFDRCFIKLPNEFDYLAAVQGEESAVWMNCDLEIFGSDSVFDFAAQNTRYQWFGGSMTVTGTNKTSPLTDDNNFGEGCKLWVSHAALDLEPGSGTLDSLFAAEQSLNLDQSILNCTLGTARDIASATNRDSMAPLNEVRRSNCAVGATGFADYQYANAMGIAKANTTVYRDAANTYDGTNRFSMEVISDNIANNLVRVMPFRFLLTVLNPGNLSGNTLRTRLITDSTLTDTEGWVEIYVKNSAGNAMQNQTTQGLPLATGTTLSTTSESVDDWTGESGGTFVAYRIDHSFSGIDTSGPAFIYYCSAKALDGATNGHLYVCPSVEVV